MRRITLPLLAIVLVMAASIGCQPKAATTVTVEKPVLVKETVVQTVTEKPVVIEWVVEGVNCNSLQKAGMAVAGAVCAKAWAQAYMDSHPGVIVNVTSVIPTDGTATQTDALILSGFGPNLLYGYGGRLSTYREYAAPLPYDPGKYRHPAIDAWVDGDSLLMYPSFAWITGLSANYKLATELGIDHLLPPLDGDRTWTFEQFEAFAVAAKARGRPALAIFAKSPSGDYWMDLWAIAFGGKLYEGGDFSRPAVDAPQWAAAWTWLKYLMDSGYTNEAPWTLDDEAVMAEMYSGYILAGGGGPVRTDAVEFHLVHYPTADGSGVPFATAPSGLMVFDNARHLRALGVADEARLAAEDAETQAAIDFAVWLNEGDFARDQLHGQHSWRTDLPSGFTPPGPDDAANEYAKREWDWLTGQVAEVGLADIGVASARYQTLRAVKVKWLAEYLQGNVSVEEALENVVIEFQAQ